MHPFYTILIFFSALITVTLGHPAGGRMPWVDCPAPTQWYTCTKTNFRGCCSVDPCNLSSCPSLLPLTSSERKCTAGTHKSYKPALYNLNTSDPTVASLSMSTISLSKSNQQLAVFESIPSSAQNCTVNWSTGATRSFNVSRNGLVDIHVVNETVIPGPYTLNRVDQWAQDMIGQADFTSWPEYPGAWIHPVSKVIPCAKKMAFWTAISGTKKGNVELVQDSESGWYLEYDC